MEYNNCTDFIACGFESGQQIYIRRSFWKRLWYIITRKPKQSGTFIIKSVEKGQIVLSKGG